MDNDSELKGDSGKFLFVWFFSIELRNFVSFKQGNLITLFKFIESSDDENEKIKNYYKSKEMW